MREKRKERERGRCERLVALKHHFPREENLSIARKWSDHQRERLRGRLVEQVVGEFIPILQANLPQSKGKIKKKLPME